MTGTQLYVPVPAKLGRRLLSLIYEALLLTALVMATALPVVMLTTSWHPGMARTLLQAVLIAVCGIYFIWQWARSGQTLAMKTWHLKLVTQSGDPLTLGRAAIRYVLALVGALIFGAGFFWAFVDREKLFLHDRLGRTLITIESEE